MFDQIVTAMTEYPYLVVAVVFLLCGLGLPLPEEIVLLASGYFCEKNPDKADLPTMMAVCATAILVGDLVPFVLGRVFGARLLRLRWMRYLVTKQRLASFDRWFRRRGDLVILIARFLAGLRVVAFFTAGIMKMPWRRFLLLDGSGIVLIVPLLTWLGSRSAGFIDEMIQTVQRVERGILWAAIGGGAVVLLWLWLWQRKRRQQRQSRPGEAFVQPQRPIAPVAGDAETAPPASSEATPATGDEPPPPAAAEPPRDPAPPT